MKMLQLPCSHFIVVYAAVYMCVLRVCIYIYIYILGEIVANAVGKCSIHMSVERNTDQND